MQQSTKNATTFLGPQKSSFFSQGLRGTAAIDMNLEVGAGAHRAKRGTFQ